MDGGNFIGPGRRPWLKVSDNRLPTREAAWRLAVCAAVVLTTFGLIVALAAAGIALPVLEVGAGP